MKPVFKIANLYFIILNYTKLLDKFRYAQKTEIRLKRCPNYRKGKLFIWIFVHTNKF